MPTLAMALLLAVLLAFDSSGQQRPGKHPEFGEGFRAFKQEEWKTVVEQMLAALDKWAEDGELTRVYGRWFEPYLPRYYLGAALYQLGCYELAHQQLEASILDQKEIKGAKKQQEALESLKLKSDRFLRQGVTEEDDAGCTNWSREIDHLNPGDAQ